MAMLVLDAFVEESLKAERAQSGVDRFDEVWDGIQVITPPADPEHEDIKSAVAVVLRNTVETAGLGTVRAGAYLSDRAEGFRENFRIPDILVALAGGAARDLGSHWIGGPDFLVEIVAPYDQSREKLEFYSAIGVRELLLVGRDPWQLELHCLARGRLEPAGRSEPGDSAALASEVVPMSFRLVAGDSRPRIEVMHHDRVQRWAV